MAKRVVFGIVTDSLHAEAVLRDLALDGVTAPDVAVFAQWSGDGRERRVVDWPGASVGGLAGALVGIGLSDAEAETYERRVRDGHVLLCVQTERQRDVERVLREQRVQEIGAVLEIFVHARPAAAPVTRPPYFPEAPVPSPTVEAPPPRTGPAGR